MKIGGSDDILKIIEIVIIAGTIRVKEMEIMRVELRDSESENMHDKDELDGDELSSRSNQNISNVRTIKKSNMSEFADDLLFKEF